MPDTVFDTLISVSVVAAFVLFVDAKMKKMTFTEALKEMWDKLEGGEEQKNGR